MFEYLNWRGDLLFACDPPNAVDMLIFATLAYCPIERLNGRYASGALEELIDALYPENVAFRSDMEKQRAQLWQAAAASPRFQEVRLAAFASHFDPGTEKQFAASLFQLDRRTAVVAFRGTDSTVVGWKEDFNMGFESPVPAQTDAVAFLNAMAQNYERVLVCGHSKGGNLALYSSVHISASLRDRLEAVYSFDGPGLDDATADSPEYALLSPRIHSYVPEASIVGMLLDYHNEYIVVESDGMGLAQHNPFLWHIKGPGFVVGESQTRSSLYTDRTLHDFLAQCAPEERRVLVDTLFELVAATGAKRLREIPMGLIRNFPAVREAFRQVPEKDRAVLSKVFRALALAGGANLDALFTGEETGDGQTPTGGEPLSL